MLGLMGLAGSKHRTAGAHRGAAVHRAAAGSTGPRRTAPGRTEMAPGRTEMAWMLGEFWLVGSRKSPSIPSRLATRPERRRPNARDRSITLAVMHIDTLTAPEQRVLGCLIEKRFTTPDQYPLTLNALRIACNQSTNRDPVVSYDEETVRAAAQRLAQYGVARLASGHSSRATKYRHLAEEALGLGREQLAVLSVLLLRGPQTPGELKGRTERIVQWQSLGDVEQVLGELIDRGYAQRLERRPGQKEERFAQVLGGGADVSVSAAPAPEPTAAQMPSAAGAARGIS